MSTNNSKSTHLGFDAKLGLIVDQTLPVTHFEVVEYRDTHPKRLCNGQRDYVCANSKDKDTTRRGSAWSSLWRRCIPRDFYRMKDPHGKLAYLIGSIQLIGRASRAKNILSRALDLVLNWFKKFKHNSIDYFFYKYYTICDEWFHFIKQKGNV